MTRGRWLGEMVLLTLVVVTLVIAVLVTAVVLAIVVKAMANHFHTGPAAHGAELGQLAMALPKRQ